MIKNGFSKVKNVAQSVAATNTVVGGTAPAPSAPPPRSIVGTLTSWSLLSIYGLILAIMVFMLIWAPTSWLAGISDLFQTVAVTLAFVGLFLLATSNVKRVLVVLMILGFIGLAFNKPVSTAGRLQAAKEEGLTAALKERPKTAQEIQRDLALIQQKAARDAETAAGEERARVAAEEAAARALEESMRDARAVPCVRIYTEHLNCITVTFSHNTKYDRELIKGHCLVSDPVSALTRTSLGGYQYRYTGQSGLVAQFFDLPIGKTVGTFTCGS
ncbi:MAG: hypothetical protein V4606_01380 [Patescibacteria group bacterium]